jgi:hypothetical protein
MRAPGMRVTQGFDQRVFSDFWIWILRLKIQMMFHFHEPSAPNGEEIQIIE